MHNKLIGHASFFEIQTSLGLISTGAKFTQIFQSLYHSLWMILPRTAWANGLRRNRRRRRLLSSWRPLPRGLVMQAREMRPPLYASTCAIVQKAVACMMVRTCVVRYVHTLGHASVFDLNELMHSKMIANLSQMGKVGQKCMSSTSVITPHMHAPECTYILYILELPHMAF